ncbi:MAG: YqiA/YcfP family alpha/beta fold hydrolase [Bacteroidales bacterium]|jgi:predicted esterase YcpF (UPF0227 family)
MAIKILYIHGYAGTGKGRTVQGLNKLLGDEVEIHAPYFAYNFSTVAEIEQYIEKAKKAMHEFRPDVVIGSSFGGFITTFLNGYSRILINPCLLPSERAYLLSPEMSPEEIEKLKALETSHDINPKMKLELYGLFGLNDELFSYLELFKKLYGTKQVYTMQSGHRIDMENVENCLIPLIRQVLEDNANFRD